VETAPGNIRPIPAGDAAAWPLGSLGIVPRGATPRVGVLGLARSGVGAARLLRARGCEVELFDLGLPEEHAEAVRALEAGGAALRLGPHDPARLDGLDLLVRSPGVPAGIPFLAEAARRRVAVISELELAFLAARGPVLAVTGTNGKSTTTAWAGDMLRETGLPAQVVGNIGRPFSEGVLEDPDACFACEVSSFQLEDVHTFRPDAAVLLNFTPDHLDRHGSLEAYLAAKLRLFDRQGPEDLAIIGPDDVLARATEGHGRARRARFAREDRGGDGAFLAGGMLVLRSGGTNTPLLPRERLALPGPHNLENALAAAAAAAALGATPEAIRRSLTGFAGLPHRLEPVGTVRGVRFVNDSKATNTDSLAVALASFDEPVILIAGGRDKGQDFRPLGPAVARATSLVILIGEGADRMAEHWAGVPAVRAGTLEEAVRLGLERARPGQVVLLSPACASFDMFHDYEDRGRCFRAAVAQLGEGVE
jgi:UDP-N-acetylmuramoylalanine--D-glutamate ligase